tara:strand:+ start:12673 stop:14208 length:1536 start_codon:yes stop_codon:yes gene_type:complete
MKLKEVDTDSLLKRLDAVENESVDAEPWTPSLSGTQQDLFDSPAKYILAYGERASGKTFVLGGHKLVRHCYEGFNALALIIVGVKSQATQGGVWHKLLTEILPEWKDGLGVEYTEQKLDLQKQPFIDIGNRYGGWSRISLMSAPFGSILVDRIKGYEPSYVFIDELTNLDSPAYFDAVVQQLGRRQGITGCQQYTSACNPSGPSSWVYKRFFESPLSEDGEWNKDYATVHVKIEENINNLPEGYYSRVIEAVSNDPIEAKRMLEGEWIDRPAGNSIFAPYFNQNLHVAGDARKGIVPNPDFPCILGWDPGAVNNAIIFLQCLVGAEKSLWTVFDEFVSVNKKLPYTTIIPLLYRKMRSWEHKVGKSLKWVHVSDNSAFNQYRAKTGSYDVKDIEEISRAKCGLFDMEPIRMRAAPKFSGSVAGRVRLLISKLTSEEIMISAQCTDILKMLRNLTSEKPRDGKYDPNLELRPQRSVYLHSFDALTYPLMYFDVGVGTPSVTTADSQIIEINA